MQTTNAIARKRFLAQPWLRCVLYCSIAYAGFVLMLWSVENRLVYPAASAERSWVAAPSPDMQDVWLTSADGTRLHAWWLPCAESDQAVLYCHGNAGNLSHRGQSLLKLREVLHASVLIFDYPGYGKSEGSPSEAGCYEAAKAAHDWLTDEKKYIPKKILLYGVSLGGGVAVDLASHSEARGLVLVKTFSSLPDVATDMYWWLPMPIHTLMSNRFDSLSKISACHCPVFIGHGTTDRLIPYAHGERLFAAANEPKCLFTMPGVDHNDGLPPAFFAALKAFLQEHPVE